jgi:hypothetical protein
MGDAEDARVSRFEGLGTARREKLEGEKPKYTTAALLIPWQEPSNGCFSYPQSHS